MYINPEVYNYNGLTTQDKTFIDGFDKALEEMSEGAVELTIDRMCADHEDRDSLAGRLKRELIEAAVQTLYEILDSTRLEIIASLIDSYDDE